MASRSLHLICLLSVIRLRRKSSDWYKIGPVVKPGKWPRSLHPPHHPLALPAACVGGVCLVLAGCAHGGWMRSGGAWMLSWGLRGQVLRKLPIEFGIRLW